MTLMFNAAFGINPGYDANSFQPTANDAEEIVSSLWQHAMEAEWQTSNILVSAICSASKVVYPERFGCPVGGERIVQATGVLNPKFNVDFEDWKQAVVRVVSAVKKELAQERVTLFFQEVESLYYLE